MISKIELDKFITDLSNEKFYYTEYGVHACNIRKLCEKYTNIIFSILDEHIDIQYTCMNIYARTYTFGFSYGDITKIQLRSRVLGIPQRFFYIDTNCDDGTTKIKISDGMLNDDYPYESISLIDYPPKWVNYIRDNYPCLIKLSPYETDKIIDVFLNSMNLKEYMKIYVCNVLRESRYIDRTKSCLNKKIMYRLESCRGFQAGYCYMDEFVQFDPYIGNNEIITEQYGSLSPIQFKPILTDNDWERICKKALDTCDIRRPSADDLIDKSSSMKYTVLKDRTATSHGKQNLKNHRKKI